MSLRLICFFSLSLLHEVEAQALVVGLKATSKPLHYAPWWRMMEERRFGEDFIDKLGDVLFVVFRPSQAVVMEGEGRI